MTWCGRFARQWVGPEQAYCCSKGRVLGQVTLGRGPRDHCFRFAYFLPQELDNGSILAFFVFRRCVTVQELDNGSILASATDEFSGGQYTDEYYNTLAYLDFCCICENLKNQRSIRAPGSEA